MRLKIGILVVTTLLVVSAGGTWWYFTTTPTYALSQIANSVREHDREAFERYVDVDGVAGSIVDQVVAEDSGQSSATTSAHKNISRGLLHLMKPRLINVLKERFFSAVEPAAPETLTTSEALQSHTNLIPNLRGATPIDRFTIKDIRIEGKLAFVAVEVPLNEERDWLLHLKMRRRGGQWQLAEIINAKGFLDALMEEEPKPKPTGRRSNASARK